jgi:hypothetical protein
LGEELLHRVFASILRELANIDFVTLLLARLGFTLFEGGALFEGGGCIRGGPLSWRLSGTSDLKIDLGHEAGCILVIHTTRS